MHLTDVLQGGFFNKPGIFFRIEIVYYNYESYFQILTRFDYKSEDKKLIPDNYYQVHLNIYNHSFNNILSKVVLTQVKDLIKLPDTIIDSQVKKAKEKKTLWFLSFDYSCIYPVGLLSLFEATTLEAQKMLSDLWKLAINNLQIQLFFKAGKSTIASIEVFQQHLQDEKDCIVDYHNSKNSYR